MLTFIFDPSINWLLLFVAALITPYVITIICNIIQFIWAWTDDFDTPYRNWFIYFIATKIFGCVHRGYDMVAYIYHDENDGHDYNNDEILGWTSFFSFVICLIILIVGWLIIFHPTIAISSAIVIGVLTLTRFVRRLSKKLTNHMENHN